MATMTASCWDGLEIDDWTMLSGEIAVTFKSVMRSNDRGT